MGTEGYASAGAGSIRWRFWEPKGEIKGVVQLTHGIAEHMGRYADFGEYLAANGYAAAAEDHMGHGESISEDLERGCIRGGWDAMVQDVHALTEKAKACEKPPVYLPCRMPSCGRAPNEQSLIFSKKYMPSIAQGPSSHERPNA